MLKSNFNAKKIEIESDKKQEFEDLVAKAGVGSHMVFRTTSCDDDDLFVDEL